VKSYSFNSSTYHVGQLADELVAATASLDGTIIPTGTILWQAEVGDGEHPLVLGQNEGFSIRSVAVPGTGTWMAAVNVDWAEVPAY